MMLCALLSSCGSKVKEQSSDVLRVVTEQVSTSNTDNGTTYVGEVEAESSTAVSFTSSGTVLRMLVEEGQAVSKGQLIAEIDATQPKNAVMAAEAMMTQAQDAYDRMKILHDRNSLSEMDWVEVQSKVQQARSSLQMAKKSLADCRLLAPCSGVIGSKSMEAGMTALPAQPVCNILNINNVKIKVSIPENEIGAITSATPSTITVAALDGAVFKGGRIEKGVSADALTRTYNIYINLQNADHRLLPGMVTNVALTAGKDAAPTALTLPVTAVQQNAKGEKFVWIVKGSKATRQNVTLGELQGNRVVITSGIASGDKVIVEGYQKVSEGSEVKS